VKKTVMTLAIMAFASVAQAQDPYAEIKANHCQQYQQMFSQVVIPRMKAGTSLSINQQYWDGSGGSYANERSFKDVTQALYERPDVIEPYIRSNKFVTDCIDWLEM
jgi:hypothetical protein